MGGGGDEVGGGGGGGGGVAFTIHITSGLVQCDCCGWLFGTCSVTSSALRSLGTRLKRIALYTYWLTVGYIS